MESSSTLLVANRKTYLHTLIMVPRPESKHDAAVQDCDDSVVVLPVDRSVNDYETNEQVQKALMAKCHAKRQDWVLDNYDIDTTIEDPNSISQESKRLLCLKSYDVLDTPPEIEFEEITRQAKNLLGCPIAVVSLVDMGRQWFKSIQGLPGVESTPRCLAFCAHVVKRKVEKGVLVVPDATKDPRFKDNALVTGGPAIRFYAGAPLLAPEGQMLGTLCVIDTEPHPEGLTGSEQDALEVFAMECVLHLVSREEEETSRSN